VGIRKLKKYKHNQKNMTTTQEENKVIKQALRKEFPNYKLSVTQGKGTACGWKHINIDTQGEENINRNEINKKSEEIVRNSCKLYTFSSDDGYGSELECMLVQVY